MLLTNFKVFTFAKYFTRVSTIRQVNYHVLARLKNPSTFSSHRNELPRRPFFWWFKKPTVSKFKEIDNVSDAYQLIYRNLMERYLFWTQILTIVSGACVGVIVITKSDYEEIPSGMYEWKKENNIETVPNEFIFFVMAFTTFVIVLHVMLGKLPIRIYYLPEQKSYQFVFYGNIPFTTYKHVCRAQQVVKCEQNGILPWGENTYKILRGNKKIILFEHCFRKPIDYNVMLGYQKDPDCDDVANK